MIDSMSFYRETLNATRGGGQKPQTSEAERRTSSNTAETGDDLFVRIALDEMGNKRLLLEDAEGNLLGSEDATTMGRFSELPGVLEEGRERLSTLPGWAREKIEALRKTENFVRNSTERASGKRKRPESFAEGDEEGGEKRKESGGGGGSVKGRIAQFEGQKDLLPSPAEDDAENGNVAGLEQLVC